MKVQCEKCQSEYNIDESRVPDAGLQIKCPKCLATFLVHKEQPQAMGNMFDLDDGELELDISTDEAPPQPSPAPAAPAGSTLPPIQSGSSTLPPLGGPAPGDAAAQPTAGAGGQLFDFLEKDIGPEPAAQQQQVRYRIRRKSGKVFGPFDLETVKKMLVDHQLMGNEEASTDGVNYKPLGAFEEFAATIRALMDEPATPAQVTAPPPPSTTPSPSADDMLAPQGVDFAEPPPESAGKSRTGAGLMLGLAGLIVLLIAGVALGFTSWGFFGINLITGGKHTGPPSGRNSSPAASPGEQQSDFLSLYHQDTYASHLAIYKQFLLKQQRAEDSQTDRLYVVLALASMLRNYGANEAYLKLARQVLETMKDEDSESRETRLAEAALNAPLNPSRAAQLLAPFAGKQSRDKEALYQAGWAAAYQKKWTEAARFFDRATVLDPDFAKVYHALGDIQAQQGDLANAALFYQKAYELNPIHLQSLVELARLRFKTGGDLGTISKMLDQVFGKHFDQLAPAEKAKAHALRAQIFARRHQHDEVVKHLQAAISLLPKKVDYLARLGSYYLEIGEYTKAHQIFDKALAQDPKNFEARLGKGRAMRKAGDIVKAKALLEALAKEKPDDPRPLYQLGEISEQLQKPDEAMNYYRRASEKSKKFLKARVAMAKLLKSQGKVAEALGTLGEAVRQNPRSAIVHNGLGEIYLAQDNLRLALQELRQAAALDPELPEAHFNLAAVLRRQKQFDQALAELERVNQLAPRFPDLALEKGYLLYLKKDYQQALKTFEQAITNNPKDDRLYFRAGQAALALGDEAAAVNYFQTATGLNSKNTEAIFELAQLYYNKQDTDKAMDLLKRIIALDEKNSQAHYHLGLCYQRQQMILDALEEFRTAIEIDPKFLDARLALGRLQIARLQVDDAIEQFSKAVALDPGRVDVKLDLGEAYLKRGEARKALRILTRVYRKNRRHPHLAYLLGRAYQDLDKNREAIKYYQEAMKIDPRDPQPHYYLGYIYKAIQRNRQAIAEFRKYLQLKPDAADADEIRDEIDYLMNE